MKIASRCVHSGTKIDVTTGGLNTPIHSSSSFAYGDSPENVYPRYFNTPNQQAVVEKLADLENAGGGLVTASGMAAISSVILALLGQGDHVVMQKDIYGGTFSFAAADFKRFGIQISFVENTADAFADALKDNSRMIYIETPSNPLLKITDIAAVAQLARAKGILTVIDNTFATPILQRPLDLGIDVVVHSGTKYLGGHSDLCCGAILADSDLIYEIRSVARNLGGSLNAQTCSLLERSLKTLALRVERQTANAALLAQRLQNHPAVATVFYPGLADHPGHMVAKQQMDAFGAMLSFELGDQFGSVKGFLKQLALVTPALSLGGVETIVCAPVETSHATLAPDERAALGISDKLLRLSVGIEAAEDIWQDLEQAFEIAGKG